MPRRGRPAQGHAPAEGVAQYDMAHLFVADAERPQPRLWGRREWWWSGWSIGGREGRQGQSWGW